MTVAKLRAPIVLVHGLMGFDRLEVCGRTFGVYWPTIAGMLEDAGNRVLIPRLSMTRGVAERAAELKRFVDRQAARDPVHLIAHSMGGLDARYMTSRLGMAARVLTLTTVATPHRGTAFADWGMHRLERVVRPVLDLFAVPRQAFYDLTTASCRRFNDHVPDAPGVRYFSVAGRHEGYWRHAGWRLAHRIVTEREGPNDGIVSVASAKYGESFEVWDGDHLSLINWCYPAAVARGTWRDPLPDYARHIRRLADEGF
jgi:triacylglycerol lipase